MRIIHVLRKPLSEGTVASNVLKHGMGGLNIAACRIGNSTRTNASKSGKGNRDVLGPSSGGGGFTHGTETVVHNHGRWPANVILQHLDGCRCSGIKRVKGIGGGASSGDNAFGQDSGWNAHQNRPTNITRQMDKDGKEAVEDWICEPECPVARLDAQTGDSVSRVGKPRASKSPGSGWGMTSTGAEYNDKGGASRFYKQVGGSK